MISLKSLNILPTGALASVSDFLAAKGEDIAARLSSEKFRLNRLKGVVRVENFINGKTIVKLKNSIEAVNKFRSLSRAAISTAEVIKDLVDGGIEPLLEGSLPEGVNISADDVRDLIAEIKDAVEGGSSDNDSEIMELQTATAERNISDLQLELDQTLESYAQVNDVISRRASGDLPEPKVNIDEHAAAVNNIINDFRSNTNLSPDDLFVLEDNIRQSSNQNLESFEKFVDNKLVIPYGENKAALDILRAQLLGQQFIEEEAPIFDTDFGPPQSTEGKFILSQDGLYYDSRTGSIPYITAQKIDARSWELRYAANRGGRGELYSKDQTERFADTILSFEYENESGTVKDFYKYDDVLLNMENDRSLQVADVSAKIDDLISQGYSISSAIVKNYQESYASVANVYDRKIKKRKKQLQVAALFGPFGVTPPGDPQGEGVFYRTVNKNNVSLPDALCGYEDKVNYLDYSASNFTEEIEYIPRIPINDFSYLKDIGLVPEIDTQKTAMLHSSDLDDTTAPLAPVFIEKGPGAQYEAIPELAIGSYGTADWVNTSGATGVSSVVSSTVEGIAPYLRTLDDSIVTDNMIVCYNFLEPSAAVEASSTDFGVRNYADTGYPLNAKLVGDSTSVFASGVSIPYLTGAVRYPRQKFGSLYNRDQGSYVRLPNNYRDNQPYPPSQPLDDLMYTQNGWCMDFWAHVPEVHGNMTYSRRYRLVAANENCGDALSSDPFTGAVTLADQRKNRTRGMIIGWRDKGWPNFPVSTTSSLEFVVLPTLAQNDTEWGKSIVIEETVSGIGGSDQCRQELGFKVPLSATTKSGFTIADVSGAFTHFNISFDLSKNLISLFVDGELLAASSISTAFGIEPSTPLNVPSRIAEGHHHETNNLFGERLYDGENLPSVPVFTPWILGGGFTDGINDTFYGKPSGFLGSNTNSSYIDPLLAGVFGGVVGQHTVLDDRLFEYYSSYELALLYAAGITPDDGGDTYESAGYYGVPGLGAYRSAQGPEALQIPRSGLDGHIGSFKMYSKPLSNLEVSKNYKAQSPFFKGIQTTNRLL